MENDSPLQLIDARNRLTTVVVTIALACGFVATGVLSVERLFRTGLPGCGVGTGCALAAESPFARIHSLPVAHPGFAFSAAMAFTWVVSGRRVNAPLVWASRAGAAVSAVYAVFIVEHGYWCGYCIIAHACNLIAWLLIERTPRSRGWRTATFALPCVFGLVLAAIAIIKPQIDRSRFEDRQRGVNAAIDSIVEEELASIRPKRWLPVPEEQGGIRIGPQGARIRITVFLDYQCAYCRTVAREVATVSQLPGVAITWRQLPHGWPCNPRVKSNLHECACRCARMAVTTAGTPDFERVHEWLLERKGTCTEDDIENALPKLITTNADKFWDRYHGSATRDAIRADLDLAEQLGLVATPAVFINGQLIDSPDIEATIRRIADRLAHGP